MSSRDTVISLLGLQEGIPLLGKLDSFQVHFVVSGVAAALDDAVPFEKGLATASYRLRLPPRYSAANRMRKAPVPTTTSLLMSTLSAGEVKLLLTALNAAMARSCVVFFSSLLVAM